MIPPQARDIFLYYGVVIILGVIFLFRRERFRRGMRLRFGRKQPAKELEETPPENVLPMNPNGYSRIEPSGERPLNVVFNFNGHSWDAYEVLGLPAGSAPDKVDEAYRAACAKIDPGSRPFLEAAYRAIQTQWKMYRAAGN